ncbi:MAG: hypothetical protein WDN00_05865 [Limisphaerales bacterium]
MQGYYALLNVPRNELLGLGRVHPADANESFCMTVLALKASRAANGVSELHGEISRQMWQSLYPNTPVEKVPIVCDHQRHSFARLDEGHRASVLAQEVDRRR